MLNGKTVHLSQAIACSNDRKVENTGNLRVVQTKNKESICYTGRTDSDHKAIEQASYIFLNELRTKGKGITPLVDERGNLVYQLDYVANSMLSIPSRALFVFQESVQESSVPQILFLRH